MSGSISAAPLAQHEDRSVKLRLLMMWLTVGVPLLWGVSKTLEKALKLFH
jgi:hypothetical protein